MNIFKKIQKWKHDSDQSAFDDAMDQCDYIAAVIVGKLNKQNNGN